MRNIRCGVTIYTLLLTSQSSSFASHPLSPIVISTAGRDLPLYLAGAGLAPKAQPAAHPQGIEYKGILYLHLRRK